MKNILSFIFSLTAFILLGMHNYSLGQQRNTGSSKPFEGKIIYRSTNLDTAHPIGLMTQYIEYIKGNRLTMDVILSGGQKDMTYVDGDSLIVTHLRTFDTTNYAIKYAAKDLQNDFVTQSQTIFSDETKTICGYLCRKALIKLPNDVGTIEVWYTNKIGNGSVNFWTGFAKIEGIILEQVRSYPSGIKYKMEAVQVIQEHVSPDRLTIPGNYTTVTVALINEKYYSNSKK